MSSRSPLRRVLLLLATPVAAVAACAVVLGGTPTAPASALPRLLNSPFPPTGQPSTPPPPAPTPSTPSQLPVRTPPTMVVDPNAPAPRPAPAPVGRARTVGAVTCRPVTVYTMSWDGVLWWMRDTDPFTASDLLQRGRTAVGRGFGLGSQTAFLGASGNGVLYRVDSYGRLFWYRHLDPVGGRARWANGGRGLLVASGFGSNLTYSIAVGPQGDLYVLTVGGTLWLYRHTGWLTGSATWANGGAPIRLGSGFGWNDRFYPAGNGVLYRSHGASTFDWYRYTLTSTSTGTTVHWANHGVGRTVGRGLDGDLLSLTGGGAGVFYRADWARTLLEFRHLDPANGRPTWAVLKGQYLAKTAVAPHDSGIGLAADPTACSSR